MTSIVELFPKCRKLAYDARQATMTGSQQSSEVSLLLDELNRQLDCMETLATKELPSARVKWKQKIAELRNESSSIRKNVQNSYAVQRHQLFQRKQQRHQATQNETQVQTLAQEADSLEQSNVAVLNLLEHADTNLGELRQQRSRLRGVSATMMNISDKLGLTNTTMKIIERRDITDAYLVAACMVFTLCVLYFTWF